VTEAAEKETQADKQPDAAPPVASSSRAPVIVASLAALIAIGAACANFLPGFGGVSLPDFRRSSPPKLDHGAALPVPNPAPVQLPAPVLVPDPVVRAGLRDIQTSQQQNVDTLASLTQSVATQQADLKRITRQLTLLTAQVNSLQNPAAAQPLTTSSIGGPLTTSGIPRPNPRTRVIHASRRAPPPVLPPATVPASLPALPKPAGPVSVGGAPLSPAPGEDRRS